LRGSIAFIGAGGQGIVFAAQLLAETLFEWGLYVAQLQSYGAEVRGGSVLAYVVFDEEPIEDPYIYRHTVAVVLHEIGLRRWRRHAEEASKVLYDRDLVKTPATTWIPVPITRRCIDAGVHGSENVAAAAIALGMAGRDMVERLRSIVARRPRAEQNLRAIDVGLELLRELEPRLGSAQL